MIFPHPCTHCGLCCIAQVCPVGQAAMRVPQQGQCPALEWEETDPDKSRCGLIAHPEKYLAPVVIARLDGHDISESLGSGKGCCISARIIINGRQTDFAPLSPEDKTTAVRAIRTHTIPLLKP